MGVSLAVIALVFDSGYALLAGRVRPWLTGDRRTRIRHGLIGSGIALGLARRGC